MDIFSAITLLGGLAMFLYGMEVMGDGLKNSSGSALKNVLGKLTQNAALGVLTGMLVTAVIQSSTATIVLTVGLLSAGILTLRQSVSIVLGANIGTTITAQIIRLMDINSTGNLLLEFCKPTTLAPMAMIIGIILIMFIKRGSKNIGAICMGFGILFSGLISMTAAVEPLSQSQWFKDLLIQFTNIPVLGIFTGLILTAIIQSSSAMIGMLQALSSTGLMTFNVAYPIIMGSNLGTCITTMAVCSIGSSKDAKRVGFVHVVFNCIGTVIFLAVMGVLHSAGAFPNLWGSTVSSGDIANFQTLFNAVTAALLLPVTNMLVKLSDVVIKSDPEEEEDAFPELRGLDEKLFVSPSMALFEANNAISQMGALARKNLLSSIKQLTGYSDSRAAKIHAREEQLDEFVDAADNFLVNLSSNIETAEDNKQLNMLMQTATDFERIGDYAINIESCAKKLREEKMIFSERAKKELELVCSAVGEITEATVEAFKGADYDKAKSIEPLEEVIDDMISIMSDNHIERLKAGKCTVNAGLLFKETLTNLERASDQCSSIALLMYSVIDDNVMRNHHEYLRMLHRGSDSEYNAVFNEKKQEYLVPIEELIRK